MLKTFSGLATSARHNAATITNAEKSRLWSPYEMSSFLKLE